MTWNGTLVAARPAGSRSLVAVRQPPGPAPVPLPDLSKATWRYSPGSPESQPGSADASWWTADLTATESTTKPPAGQVVLTADDYGFHHGDVWYRGTSPVRPRPA